MLLEPGKHSVVWKRKRFLFLLVPQHTPLTDLYPLPHCLSLCPWESQKLLLNQRTSGLAVGMPRVLPVETSFFR